MVTQHSWMFLRNFAPLRAVPEEKLQEAIKQGTFTGLLRETRIETLAHLGEFAFEEAAAAGAFVAMFVFANRKPSNEDRMAAFRLVGLKNSLEKGQFLETRPTNITSNPRQNDFIAIPETPIVYWVRPRILSILKSQRRINIGDDKIAGVHVGLCTGNNSRFIRYSWEIPYNPVRWPYCARAGRYQKWWGLNYSHATWRIGGAEYIETNGSAVRNSHKYFQKGVTYGRISRGAMGARLFWGDELFE
jgi:hypothetical protein